MAFEINNIYENMVITSITEHFGDSKEFDHEELEDLACIALNQLPAKYVRHPIDAHAALSAEEHDKRDEEIADAIQYAIDLVKHRRQDKH